MRKKERKKERERERERDGKDTTVWESETTASAIVKIMELFGVMKFS